MMEQMPWAPLSTPIERVLIALRWVSLGMAIGLSFIDRAVEGVLVTPFPLAAGIAVYFLAVTLVPPLLRLPARPILVLSLDALMATLAVYLSGGYHSAFFVLYIFVMISVAFYFNVAASILLANLCAFLYVLSCLISPAGFAAPWATYLLGTKLALLVVVALVTSLLLEQLRIERQHSTQEKELAEAQSTFVSMVSHELQTPLTCIKSSVEILLAMEEQSPDGDRLELLRNVSDHSTRLESLVSDLLQTTKLEANQVVLTRQPTDLARMLQRVAQGFGPLFGQKQQVLVLDLTPDIPRVWIDRGYFEQIVGNLLSNAHKFTPAGGHIVLGLHRHGDDAHISVRDDGPGIPANEQSKVFDKFYVGSDRRRRAGVGLGLYIARRLVDLHGGQIALRSAPGVGSTFTVALPITGGERLDDEATGSR